MINKLKDEHQKKQKEEIFEEDDNEGEAKFDEMRSTKTGFGTKVNQFGAQGRLQPGEDSEGEEEDGDEDEEDEDGIDVDEDGDESDHNF